jgi:hypothetical protein
VLDFSKALDLATEKAGDRLKLAYQKSVIYDPVNSEGQSLDPEWVLARKK